MKYCNKPPFGSFITHSSHYPRKIFQSTKPKKNWNFDSLCKFKPIFESFVRKKPHSFITMIFFISHQTESDLKIHEKYYYICIKVFFLFFSYQNANSFHFYLHKPKKSEKKNENLNFPAKNILLFVCFFQLN